MHEPPSDRQRQDRRTALLRVSAFIASTVLVILVWPRQTTSPPSFRDILLITVDAAAVPAPPAGHALRLSVSGVADPLIGPSEWRELERLGYRASAVAEPGEALLAVERWLRSEDEATPRKPLFLWLDLKEPAEASTFVEGTLTLWRRQRPGWEPVTAVLYRNERASFVDIRAPQEQPWAPPAGPAHASQLLPSLLAVAGAGLDEKSIPLRRR